MHKTPNNNSSFSDIVFITEAIECCLCAWFTFNCRADADAGAAASAVVCCLLLSFFRLHFSTFLVCQRMNHHKSSDIQPYGRPRWSKYEKKIVERSMPQFNLNKFYSGSRCLCSLSFSQSEIGILSLDSIHSLSLSVYWHMVQESISKTQSVCHVNSCAFSETNRQTKKSWALEWAWACSKCQTHSPNPSDVCIKMKSILAFFFGFVVVDCR